MAPTVQELPLMTRNAFIHALESGVTGINIIATAGSAGRAGAVVDTLTSVSADRKLLMICLHRDHPLCPIIEENRRFSINVLSEMQKPIAQAFSGPDAQREGFEHGHWTESPAGNLLLHGAIAGFDCQLYNQLALDSHVLLVGEVQTVHRHPGMPLAKQARHYVLIQRDQP